MDNEYYLDHMDVELGEDDKADNGCPECIVKEKDCGGHMNRLHPLLNFS